MILFEKTRTYGLEAAIRGMRNPKNSWDKSDSEYDSQLQYHVGPNDLKLMTSLVRSGDDHSKFMRMIIFVVDITAPLYWWKEFDTYKVGTVADSCSTMHKLADRDLTMKDFSHEHLTGLSEEMLDATVKVLNIYRSNFLETKDKKYWYQMIQLLPTSYNQKRTVQMNYQVLRHIYFARRNHKLDEWRTMCDFIAGLPYAKDLILVE